MKSNIRLPRFGFWRAIALLLFGFGAAAIWLRFTRGLGAVTNLSARLCGEAKDGQILISPRIFSKTETQIEVEAVGELSLKGFHRPVFVHNVLNVDAEGSN